MEKVYEVSQRHKKKMTVLGVISCLTVVGIPTGIFILWSASRPRIVVRDENFELRWFGTRTVRWDDITKIEMVPIPAFHGVAITYTLKSKPKASPRILLTAFENHPEFFEELKKRTGLNMLD